ncbi:L-serine ammonia-lyase [Dactylosporangium sp. NPDC051484]|uniref:L-serine ammonia-lyase n=1 Tax=Dactylosporangium sp. NPDC051484 TaxID=3154942 RepID=UPI0034508008
MALSAFDLYSVGIGPSSSHTVGPMRAAKIFADTLVRDQRTPLVHRVRADLYGSLAATGRGHGTPKAVILGLEGDDPATVDIDHIDERVETITRRHTLTLPGGHVIAFEPDRDITLHRRRTLPAHPNGMSFTAYADDGTILDQRTFYSIGGGFVVDAAADGTIALVPDDTVVRYPFTTAAELLAHCHETGLPISEIMLANERAWRTTEQIRAGLLSLWQAMAECVERGCHRSGVLPGGLKVPRRAPGLFTKLSTGHDSTDPLRAVDWINLYALAVNEENAAGGRIVTAPTNGAAGIIPAVLHYYVRFVAGASDDGIVRFLLTAAAIGIIIKENASISGAEVGCQGEVGSACAMAAAGLCEVTGGSPEQVENAAEVGIEHNLGLTCDPIGGLVQIPCIERNAIASVKAVNAARLALHGTGNHSVSLDKAVKTMRQTGYDMHTKYKETSRGGLAVNIVEC